ncbi:MAG: UDP-3-O-(3-hydroxymyristoyl)glucosamine N-acyltransferase [Desulfobacteraceae bacterium]
MHLTVKEIARIINADISGNENLKINDAQSFESASAEAVTFASDVRFLKKLNSTNAGAVIVPDDFSKFSDETGPDLPVLLKVKDPKYHFFKILALFYPEKQYPGSISRTAVIGMNVTLGKDVYIGHNALIGGNTIIGDRTVVMPNVFIGEDVSIGEDSVIKPNVTIMERSEIGSKVMIHSGTVIGSDGFGFTPHDSEHEKILHAGYVRIDDHVEIGACNTIDRGTFGRTHIMAGVKTDNLVHIAHNVIIGKRSLIVGQAGIAGSATIGENVIIAGKAGVSGHLHVGDNAIVGPGAGVTSNVQAGKIVSGIPQMPHKLWLKIARILPRLPEMRKKMAMLEKKITELEHKKE